MSETRMISDTRFKEPTRIANLRKRLQRIEQTKARIREGGPPPDRRQLSALENEESIRGEVANWEKYGMVNPPRPPAQPRRAEEPLGNLDAAALFGYGGEPTQTLAQLALEFGNQASPAIPPGGWPQIPDPPRPHTPVNRELCRALAYPNTQRTEKEPTRIVNLRRRLQRILATHERIDRTDQPAPDNRQMAALAAEAEIAWEIQQWELYRIIYPKKLEMRYVPPGSLAPLTDESTDCESSAENQSESHENRQFGGTTSPTFQVFNEAAKNTGIGWEDSKNSGLRLPTEPFLLSKQGLGLNGFPQTQQSTTLNAAAVPFPGMGSILTTTQSPVSQKQNQGLPVASANPPAEVAALGGSQFLNMTPHSVTPQNLQNLATAFGSNSVFGQSAPLRTSQLSFQQEQQQHDQHLNPLGALNGIGLTMGASTAQRSTTPAQGNSATAINPVNLLQTSLTTLLLSKPGQTVATAPLGLAPAPSGSEVPAAETHPAKEPTRIVNLRRRLQRIQNTKSKLGQARGPQPDNRQLAALEAEPAIQWEIEQWEKFGILVQKKEEEEEAAGRETERDSQAALESSMDLWETAVREAKAKEKAKRQECVQRSRQQPNGIPESLTSESDEGKAENKEDCDDLPFCPVLNISDLLSTQGWENSSVDTQLAINQRRSLSEKLLESQTDHLLIRIRNNSGTLVHRKYYSDDLNYPSEEESPQRRLRSLSVGSNDSDIDFDSWIPQEKSKTSSGEGNGVDTMCAKKEPQDLTLGQDGENHSLENTWSIWFDEDQQACEATTPLSSMTEIGVFNTIQGFWLYWNNLRVTHLKDNCNLRFFKSGIKPTGAENTQQNKSWGGAVGGRWIARDVPKSKRSKIWGDIVMATVGESLEYCSHEKVCGVVLSTRPENDMIQVWTDGGVANEKDQAAPTGGSFGMEDKLSAVFEHDTPLTFVYEAHQQNQDGLVLGVPSAEQVAQSLGPSVWENGEGVAHRLNGPHWSGGQCGNSAWLASVLQTFSLAK